MADTPAIHLPPPPRRVAAFLVPCLVFLLICSLCLNETMMYSPDSVNYLGWARSLSRLQGFTNTMGPEAERYVFNAPLYPVLLAPVALAFPLGVMAAKIATLLAGALALLAFQISLSRKLGGAAGLGAGLFLAINPLFILYSTQVLSDIPFAACCVLAMVFLERLIRHPEEETRSSILLLTAVCGALFLREVGIAVVFAASVALILRQRTRPLLLLLIAVSVTYGLWFMRNELVVARAENPGLRNMSLIFSNVYTASGSSPLAEITARISRSIAFYGPALLSLIVAPFRLAWTYSVTDSTDRLLAAVQEIVGAARWLLAVITAVPVVLGARRVFRDEVQGTFLTALVPSYGVIIALYPVSDVRFLFPALLLLLWCAAAGTAQIVSRVNPRLKRAGASATVLLLVILAIPNLAWIRNVASTNAAYRKDPEAYVASSAKNDPFPGELMLIPRRAAEWVRTHSPAGTMVGSKIKASALWLDGRPLVVLNPLLPVEEFDNRIRDYGIRFLVCELQAHQVPDFALQMALSNRNTFSPVFAFGDVEVFAVRGKTGGGEPSLAPPPGGYGATETRFLQGVYALARGDGRGAVPLFESMERIPGVESSGLFYAAVAHEFAMDLDTADALFAGFRMIPQSAAYLRQAQAHEDIIAILRGAAGDLPPEEKASAYQEAAMRYWILGFRTQGVRMLREALRLDPGYFVGNVFGAVFSLAGGDTAGAREGVRLAERAQPTDPLTRALRSILASIDSLPRAERKGSLELAIGRSYAAMGLYEMGIDQAIKALRTGEDPEALRFLAGLYVTKERYAPALAALRRLSAVAPGDSAAREEIRRISRRVD